MRCPECSGVCITMGHVNQSVLIVEDNAGCLDFRESLIDVLLNWREGNTLGQNLSTVL